MIALKQIMVALDFTDKVESTVRYAADLAELFNAEVVGCHILEPPASLFRGVVGVNLLASNAREKTESLLQNAGVQQMRVLTKHGNPSHEIPRLTRNEGIVLIVIGTQGRRRQVTWLNSKSRGSSSSLPRAGCPRTQLKSGFHFTSLMRAERFNYETVY